MPTLSPMLVASFHHELEKIAKVSALLLKKKRKGEAFEKVSAIPSNQSNVWQADTGGFGGSLPKPPASNLPMKMPNAITPSVKPMGFKMPALGRRGMLGLAAVGAGAAGLASGWMAGRASGSIKRAELHKVALSPELKRRAGVKAYRQGIDLLHRSMPGEAKGRGAAAMRKLDQGDFFFGGPGGFGATTEGRASAADAQAAMHELRKENTRVNAMRYGSTFAAGVGAGAVGGYLLRRKRTKLEEDGL